MKTKLLYKEKGKNIRLMEGAFKFLISVVAILTVFALAFGVANAAPLSAITLDTPANNNVMTGTLYCLNATTTGDTATNVTFWYRIGSSGAFTPFVENETANSGNTIFGNCIDTTAVLGGDSGTYEINASAVENETLNAVSDVNTGIFVDNAAPRVIYEMTRDVVGRLSANGITLDCRKSSDSLDGVLDYLITVTQPSNTAVTSTLSTYDFVGSNLEELGVYTTTCRVTDHASLATTSSSLSFRVVNEDDTVLPTAARIATSATGKAGRTLIYVIAGGVLVVLLLLLSLFLLVRRKKK